MRYHNLLLDILNNNNMIKNISFKFNKTTIKKAFFSFLRSASWSFIGVLLTVFFFFIQKTTYDFRISVDRIINLVEVRENIPYLKITYKGEDILKNNKEIKILHLTIRNEGEVIHQDYYDKNKPFGIKFHDSTILSTEIKESNSDYLKSNILQQTIVVENHEKKDVNIAKEYFQTEPKEDELYLSKLIFEKGKYITFKLYLLCPVGSETFNISFIGKIANIDEVKISLN